MAGRRTHTTSRPGNDQRVRIVSPVSDREWTGVVLKWTNGAPLVSTDDTAERRYFPASWVAEVHGAPVPTPAFECETPEADKAARGVMVLTGMSREELDELGGFGGAS